MTTKFGEHNVMYRGPIYWNMLPLMIKSSATFDQFKLALKSYNGFHYMDL